MTKYLNNYHEKNTNNYESIFQSKHRLSNKQTQSSTVLWSHDLVCGSD